MTEPTSTPKARIASYIALAVTAVSLIALVVIGASLSSTSSDRDASDRHSRMLTAAASKDVAAIKKVKAEQKATTAELADVRKSPLHKKYESAESAATRESKRVESLKSTVSDLRDQLGTIRTKRDIAYFRKTPLEQIMCSDWMTTTSDSRMEIFPLTNAAVDSECATLKRSDRGTVDLMSVLLSASIGGDISSADVDSDTAPLINSRNTTPKPATSTSPGTGSWTYESALELETQKMQECLDEGVPAPSKEQFDCAHARMPAQAVAALE